MPSSAARSASLSAVPAFGAAARHRGDREFESLYPSAASHMKNCRPGVTRGSVVINLGEMLGLPHWIRLN
jgi:hypothetical protein